MLTNLRKSLIAAAIACLALGQAAVMAPAALAATTNQAPAVQVEILSFHISGQYTATLSNVVKFNLPFSAQLIGAQATARASGGTSPTLTVDVKEAGVTVLSSAMAITAGTVAEGTITDASLADEAAITVDLTIGGTSPTWNDITVLLTVVR